MFVSHDKQYKIVCCRIVFGVYTGAIFDPLGPKKNEVCTPCHHEYAVLAALHCWFMVKSYKIVNPTKNLKQSSSQSERSKAMLCIQTQTDYQIEQKSPINFCRHPSSVYFFAFHNHLALKCHTFGTSFIFQNFRPAFSVHFLMWLQRIANTWMILQHIFSKQSPSFPHFQIR